MATEAFQPGNVVRVIQHATATYAKDHRGQAVVVDRLARDFDSIWWVRPFVGDEFPINTSDLERLDDA